MLNLQKHSISWAIKSLRMHSDTYLFPFPFEFYAINDFESDIIDRVHKMDIHKEGIRPYRRALTPKSRLGFRIATQLDPIDSVVTHAILYEIYKDIEDARLPKSDEIVYSFRLAPQEDGTMYDPRYSWKTFHEKAVSILNTEDYSHVLVTDIADFFPSIYLHDIETVLHEAVRNSGRTSHIEVFINHIKAMHLKQTHKGIPVGPQFSRPIAELILNSVDRQLLERRIRFIRFMDDYIAFFPSETSAYDGLISFARLLYDCRNLKLNQHKTEIMTKTDFLTKRSHNSRLQTTTSLRHNVNNVLQEIGMSTDPYDDLEWAQVSPENREKLNDLNLEKDLIAELKKNDNLDYGVVSFLLNNLARIDNKKIANLVLQEEQLRKLTPKLRSIIFYLEKISTFSRDEKRNIGRTVLSLLESPYVGNLEFNRMWLLNLFARSDEWDNQEMLAPLLDKYDDSLTQRELFLALGRSKNREYYRSNKSQNLNQDPWVSRAFTAGISCLPKSERKPWFESRKLMHRDFLDQIVEEWALKNPFPG